VSYLVQIVVAPPDPKAQLTDSEASGCCNPTLTADRAKLLSIQKKIDAQTEVRAGHIKWMQDATDAIAKVNRQMSQTNETVFELTQDIAVLQQQIDQINKKIRADILQQNLEDAQAQLATIEQQQQAIATQAASLSGQAASLIEKNNGFEKQLDKIPPGIIPQVVADQNAPSTS